MSIYAVLSKVTLLDVGVTLRNGLSTLLPFPPTLAIQITSAPVFTPENETVTLAAVPFRIRDELKVVLFA